MPFSKAKMILIHCAVLTAFLAVTTGTVSDHPSHPHHGRRVSWEEVQKDRQEARASTGRETPATLWPLPQEYSAKEKIAFLDNFRFVIKGPSCDILDAAIQRYYKTIFGRDWKKKTAKSNPSEYHTGYDRTASRLSQLTVWINPQNPCRDKDIPDVDMDEHYEIHIREPVFPSYLAGNTIWGVLRGLETFSQLIWRLEDGLLVVNQSIIADWPRFSHRGLMLDTSRHFITKSVILQNLDIMAMNKYNVFHWHIVDDHSFPYQSRRFPDLSTLGAWEPYSHVYTQSDIAQVIEAARLRGIRVIVEFDTPGHASSWGPALTQLLTPCYTNGSLDGTYGPINPTLNSTYDTLREFFTEITEVFPDQYLHLGGDEVDFSCWHSNPDVNAFMKASGFGEDYARLEEFYVQTLIDLLDKIKRTGKGRKGEENAKHEYVVWQEVFDNNVTLDNNTIVHVWKDGWQPEMVNVTKAGMRAILSSCWYLNYISYGPDWQTYYKCDPQHFNGSEEQKNLVIGGETCMWGEYVDSTNVIIHLWPRASAVAERLWSDESITDIEDAEKRLRRHRCLMIKRGVPAEPNLGPDFCQPEYESP